MLFAQKNSVTCLPKIPCANGSELKTYYARHILVKLTVFSMLDYGDAIYKMASKYALNGLAVLYHLPLALSGIHSIDQATLSFLPFIFQAQADKALAVI